MESLQPPQPPPPPPPPGTHQKKENTDLTCFDVGDPKECVAVLTKAFTCDTDPIQLTKTLENANIAMDSDPSVCQSLRMAGLGSCTVGLMHIFPKDQHLQMEALRCLVLLTSQDDDHLVAEDANVGEAKSSSSSSSSNSRSEHKLESRERKLGSGLRECAILMLDEASKGNRNIASVVVAAARSFSTDADALLRCSAVLTSLAANSEYRCSRLMRLGAGTLLLEMMHQKSTDARVVEAGVMAVGLLAAESKSRSLALIELGLIELLVESLRRFGATGTFAACKNMMLINSICYCINFLISDGGYFAHSRIQASEIPAILQSMVEGISSARDTGGFEHQGTPSAAEDRFQFHEEDFDELIGAITSAIESIEEPDEDENDSDSSSVCLLS